MNFQTWRLEKLKWQLGGQLADPVKEMVDENSQLQPNLDLNSAFQTSDMQEHKKVAKDQEEGFCQFWKKSALSQIEGQ